MFRCFSVRLYCLSSLLSWALLPVAAVAENASSWELIVTGSHRELLTRVDLPESGRRCLVWNHSVQGFPVVDCFRVEGNQLILDSSQTPDFAAGLGYTSGRGILKSDNQHGYRIVDMNVLIPNNILRLRVGSQSVNHRIKTDFRTVSLSRLSSNDRVEIRLSAADDKGTKLK